MNVYVKKSLFLRMNEEGLCLNDLNQKHFEFEAKFQQHVSGILRHGVQRARWGRPSAGAEGPAPVSFREVVSCKGLEPVC